MNLLTNPKQQIRKVARALFSLAIIFFIQCEKIEPERKVKVITDSFSDLSYTSVVLEGSLIDVGEDGVLDHGHCWHTSENPTIRNSMKSKGKKTTSGSFECTANGLSEGTKYYYKAFARTNKDTIYGDNKTFSTLTSGGTQTKPSVSTVTVTSVTQFTAICGGEVTNDGGSEVSARGVCYNTSGNPDRNGDDLYTSDGSGTGSFVSGLTGLSASTKYYVRAYAQNSKGFGYGEIKEFTTDNPDPIGSVPSVYTESVTSIGKYSAISGGNVSDDGGSSVTSRGICWNTSGNPTPESDSYKDAGTGTGSFDAEITGLSESVQYYVRAYAKNSTGTGYGSDRVFTTSTDAIVATYEIGNVQPSSAECSGNVTYDGGTDVSDRGICWGTSPSPTTSGNSQSGGTGTGTFTVTLGGLQSATLYYARAYAVNINGVVYGDDVSFVTSFSDSRDGKIYPVVKMGSQYWMAENLNYGTRINISTGQSDNSSYEKYCYDDSESNCNIYGGLYTWEEAMQYSNTESTRGVCPSGWHIPSDDEWKTLETTLGMSQSEADNSGWRGTDQGAQLKVEGTSYWNSPNEASNSSGFSAMPGGYSHNNTIYGEGYAGLHDHAMYYTSTSSTAYNDIVYRYLEHQEAKISRSTHGWHKDGASIRCIKD